MSAIENNQTQIELWNDLAQQFGDVAGHEKINILAPAYRALWSKYSDLLLTQSDGKVHAIDSGCGHGLLTRMMSTAGEDTNHPEITFDLQDTSEEMLTIAQSHLSSNPDFADVKLVQDLNSLDADSYNLATTNFVVCCFDKSNELRNYFSSVHQLVQKNGLFIVTNSHPVFLDREHSSYTANTGDINPSLLEDGTIIQGYMYGDDGTEMGPFDSVHWSLDGINQAALDTGWTAIENVAIFDNIPSQARAASKKPAFVQMVFQKLDHN